MTVVKPPDYFRRVRTDIADLLDASYKGVLDIGCGTGNTAGWLKETGRCAWAGGVEPTGAAAEAARRLDYIFAGGVEDFLNSADRPPVDLILCLDVLEHLVDPWTAVRRLAGLLPPGGTLIASLPNVRFYKVSLPLVLHGRWEYQSEGILDATHLRFFTRDTALGLLTSAGLVVDRQAANSCLKPWKNKWFLNKLSGGRLEDLFIHQYLLRGRMS